MAQGKEGDPPQPEGDFIVLASGSCSYDTLPQFSNFLNLITSTKAYKGWLTPTDVITHFVVSIPTCGFPSVSRPWWLMEKEGPKVCLCVTVCRLSNENNWHLWLLCINTRLLLQFNWPEGYPKFSHTVYISINTPIALHYYQALVATPFLGEQFQNILPNSSIKWEGYPVFLTVDIKVNCILGVFDAIHDLTAISSRVTGTKLDHCQWGVTYILRMAGHRYTVPVAGAYFDHSILCHQHCGFCISLYFGPFDT